MPLREERELWASYRLCMGLADVCNDLAKLCSDPSSAKEFRYKASVFKALGNIFVPSKKVAGA